MTESVTKWLGCGLDNKGIMVRFLAGATNLSLFSKRPERLWGPHSPLFSGHQNNRPEREIGHSPICSAEVRNEWSYSSTFERVRGMDMDCFTFCCG